MGVRAFLWRQGQLCRRSYAASLDHYSLHFCAFRPQTMIYSCGPDHALSGAKGRGLLADRNKAFTGNTDHVDIKRRRMLIDGRIG
jgi:hypothetical protein